MYLSSFASWWYSFLRISFHFWLTIFLPSLWQISSSLDKRGLMKTSMKTECSCSLQAVHCASSVLIQIYCKKKLFWGWVTDALTYVDSSVSLGFIILLNSSSKIKVPGFPLDPWYISSQVLGHFRNIKYGFHVVSGHKPKHKVVAYSNNICITTAQYFLQSCYFVGHRICNCDIDGYLCPLVVCQSIFQYHEHYSLGVKLLVRHQLNFFMLDDTGKRFPQQ